MRVLLVEDEEHKATDLTHRISQKGGIGDTLEVAASVREAVLYVIQQEFDLVVLDMALPTFPRSGPDGNLGGGIAQSGGGIEVLRSLQASSRSPAIIIVTQYPEIIINDERARPHQVAKIIHRRYNQNVIGTVIYSFNTRQWEIEFDKLLGKIK